MGSCISSSSNNTNHIAKILQNSVLKYCNFSFETYKKLSPFFNQISSSPADDFKIEPQCFYIIDHHLDFKLELDQNENKNDSSSSTNIFPKEGGDHFGSLDINSFNTSFRPILDNPIFLLQLSHENWLQISQQYPQESSILTSIFSPNFTYLLDKFPLFHSLSDFHQNIVKFYFISVTFSPQQIVCDINQHPILIFPLSGTFQNQYDQKSIDNLPNLISCLFNVPTIYQWTSNSLSQAFIIPFSYWEIILKHIPLLQDRWNEMKKLKKYFFLETIIKKMSDINENTLHLIASICQIEYFFKDIILDSDTKCNTLYFVCEGQVSLYYQQQNIGSFNAGSFFGYCDKDPIMNYIQYRADSSTLIMTLSFSNLSSFLEIHPHLEGFVQQFLRLFSPLFPRLQSCLSSHNNISPIISLPASQLLSSTFSLHYYRKESSLFLSPGQDLPGFVVLQGVFEGRHQQSIIELTYGDSWGLQPLSNPLKPLICTFSLIADTMTHGATLLIINQLMLRKIQPFLDPSIVESFTSIFKQSAIRYLRALHIPFFIRLTDSQLYKFWTHMNVKSFDNGQIISAMGKHQSTFYYIIDGCITDGETTYSSGQYFGQTALFSHKRLSYQNNIIASSKSVVLAFTTPGLKNLFSDDHLSISYFKLLILKQNSTVEEFISHPLAFLENEKSQENITFWRAINDVENLHNPQELVSLSQKIPLAIKKSLKLPVNYHLPLPSSHEEIFQKILSEVIHHLNEPFEQFKSDQLFQDFLIELEYNTSLGPFLIQKKGFHQKKNSAYSLQIIESKMEESYF